MGSRRSVFFSPKKQTDIQSGRMMKSRDPNLAKTRSSVPIIFGTPVNASRIEKFRCPNAKGICCQYEKESFSYCMANKSLSSIVLFKLYSVDIALKTLQYF